MNVPDVIFEQMKITLIFESIEHEYGNKTVTIFVADGVNKRSLKN